MTQTFQVPLFPGSVPVPEGGAGVEPGAGAAPLPAALRATLGKVEHAAAGEDGVEVVHEARKSLKEYRALLRLVPGAAARAARRHAAEVARQLAPARDRATAREALDLLEGVGLAADLQAARAALGVADDSQADGDLEALRAILAGFRADAGARLEAGLEAEAAGADLVAGLRRGYRAARRGRLDAAVALHETRKRVVTHRYQMSFAATYLTGRGAVRAGRAQRLRDVLGAFQDLETLRPMLHDAAPRLEPGVVKRLDHAMARLQKRLRRHAQRQHKALFGASSRQFARKLERRLAAAEAA
ncbi:CHAD domain-containing protein [Xanthobacter sp. V4C-4]|uniref:CHAD domain-containing protein n=1 Tax=Xanthobacter cornucopiae TaxID=3119924 RepID=UPI00372BB8FD